MLRRVAVLIVLTLTFGSARLLACELACVDVRPSPAASCHDPGHGTRASAPQPDHCIADGPAAAPAAVKPGAGPVSERLALTASTATALPPHAPLASPPAWRTVRPAPVERLLHPVLRI